MDPRPVAEPMVSVIIPAFNRARTIRAAMESVLRQTYADFELIIVDDASTDATMEEAASLVDDRIRLICMPHNLGSSGARNIGISNARGYWIAFQDSDDEWLPTKLEKQMSRLLAPGADHIASYCGLLTVTPLDHHVGTRTAPRYTPGPDITGIETGLVDALMEKSFVSTQTLIVSRAALDAIGGFDQSLHAVEDWDLALRLAQYGAFAFVDEPLVLQHFSPNSLSRDNRKLLAAQRQLLDKHARLFCRRPALLAWHYYLLAGGCRRQGDLQGARAYLLKALRLQPANPRYLAMSSLVALRSLMPILGTTTL